jgi:glycogen debranching enzyme
MRVIEKHLLTPYGLRTLSPDDPNYKGMYVGGQFERDQAYHQGTVWPFLIGPFIDGFLKVNNFDYKAKKKAAQFLEPLILHMSEEGCLGSISEIFDGDSPHQPRGCFAQAWSVAEVIRAYKLIAS